MSSLFGALGTASHALDVLEQAMGVVQNNVSNASTPGYVTQTLQLNAGLFDPSQAEWGGVSAGNVTSSRNNFAESSVWSANAQLGSAAQQSTSLQAIQSSFDVSGTSGIPGALNTLYSAFSAWSSTPLSATAQQQVLSGAQGVTQTFNSTATNLATVRDQAGQQTKSVVTQINQLTSQIASINDQIRNGNQQNGGLQAQLYNNLERLSNLVDITAQTQSDGTVSVLAGGGQIALVTGATTHALTAAATNPSGSTSNAPPDQQILDENGTDVAGKIEGGQLGGLLQVTNSVLPSVTGGVNQLAQGIVDTVNRLLTSGQTPSGAPGVALFTYNSSNDAARTLGVSSTISASQLAPVQPGPPPVANGIASQLAALQTNSNDLNGQSFTDFYSSLASNVGSLASGASQAQQSQSQALTQAQGARSQVSGVSLNDQAAALLQFQDAYQASAQALSTIRSTINYLMQTFEAVQ